MHKINYLSDYRPSAFLIDVTHLYIDIQETETQVRSILHVRRNPNSELHEENLRLNGEDLRLISIALDGVPLNINQYQLEYDALVVPDLSDLFTLEIVVAIQPSTNTKLSGLYQSGNNFCTQCESHGFRRITYYLDRPDVLSRFTTTISADQQRFPVLLSNGNLIEQKKLANGRHWVHWQDPSLKPAYLFALVAGDFNYLEDHFTTMSGRDITLRLYLEKNHDLQKGRFALTALQHAMRWDEQTFGREYDLDIYMVVAVSDFNMGAMENKGLNIFNDKYILADAISATDFDHMNVERVIGHEYFHNWSGNRVTCRDWFQLTLKEGLTVFREQLFTEDQFSAGIMRIDVVDQIRTRQFAEDRGPNAHPIRPISYIEMNNFYTATVYEKGAEVIRMVYTFLGKELFRRGMDLYFSRHDGSAVTVEDFIQAMTDVSQRDFTQFFRWYQQSGTPELTIHDQYDTHTQTYTLTVKQYCPPTADQTTKEYLQMPLAIGLLGEDGKPLSYQCDMAIVEGKPHQQPMQSTAVLEINSEEQTFYFSQVASKPIPSLLRQFSAPVKLLFPYTPEQLVTLWQYDVDAVSRWDAGVKLMTIIAEQRITAQDLTAELPEFFIEAFQYLLMNQHEDRQLISRLLSLPTERYWLQTLTSIPIDQLCTVYLILKEQLGEQFKTEFFDSYQQLTDLQTHYEFTEPAVGLRALKNLCLSYLLATNETIYADLAWEQFSTSDNMTDTIGALAALNDYSGEIRQQAFAAFYEQWQHHPLIINKWLTLQASSRRADTVEQVQALLHHPGFSLTNPNKVYALLGAFTQNMGQFHRLDGSGYHLIADQVIIIDPQNPQVAARVVEPLTRWKQLDSTRQQLMRQQLERVQEQPHLSKDLYELVHKSLT